MKLLELNLRDYEGMSIRSLPLFDLEQFLFSCHVSEELLDKIEKAETIIFYQGWNCKVLKCPDKYSGLLEGIYSREYFERVYANLYNTFYDEKLEKFYNDYISDANE